MVFLFVLLAVSHGIAQNIETLDAWTLCCNDKPLYGYGDPDIDVINPPRGNYTEILVWVPSLLRNYTIMTNQTTCKSYQYHISVYAIRWPFFKDCCFASEREASDLAKNINSALFDSLFITIGILFGIGSLLHCLCCTS